MTAKRNYSRYFIILQEDEKGYAIDPNKFPTGYAKVERKNNKCKVSYYVQNLKKSKDAYCMVLICDRKKDKRLVKLGDINIDDYGRAEISYEYDINNVANCNIPMDNIKGASIVKIKDANVHGILTGFVSGANLDDWKSYVVIEGEKRMEKEVEEEKANISDEDQQENIFDKYEKDIEEHKETTEENEDESIVVQGEAKEEIKEDEEDKINDNMRDEQNGEENVEDVKEDSGLSNREVQEVVSNMEVKDDDIEEKEILEDEIKEKDIEIDSEDVRKCSCDKKCKDKDKEKKKEKSKDKSKDKSKEKEKEKCPYEDYCHMNWENEFHKHIVEGLKEVKGVCGEVGKCQWYKIDYMDLVQIRPGMDFSKYSIIYYPMINYYSYIMRKGHYLMGFKYDKDGKMKYLVYGIPGTKSIIDQPFNGATGFVTWVPENMDDNNKNSKGYWIMFYDFKKCTVVIPVKK